MLKYELGVYVQHREGDIDPDKNYFNQLSHHLSKSSNYHTEESFNKFI